MTTHHDDIGMIAEMQGIFPGVLTICMHVFRHHIDLGKLFVSLVQTDARLEIVTPPRWGLVCFRLRVSQLLLVSLLSMRHTPILVTLS